MHGRGAVLHACGRRHASNGGSALLQAKVASTPLARRTEPNPGKVHTGRPTSPFPGHQSALRARYGPCFSTVRNTGYRAIASTMTKVQEFRPWPPQRRSL